MMTGRMIAMSQNLLSTLAAMASCNVPTPVTHGDGVSWVDGGGYQQFNTAMLNSPVTSQGDLAARVAQLSSRFAPRSFALWICEGLLEPGLRRSVERHLKAEGLRLTSTSPALTVEALGPSPGLPTPLVFRPVRDEVDGRSFGHIVLTSFLGAGRELAETYRQRSLWQTDFRGYIASVDGVDVCAGAAYPACGVTGIYSVATLPTYQRRGYAAALMRHAVTQVNQQYGVLPLVLQSTGAAARLYRRLGFQSLTTFSCYTHE